DQTPVAMVWSDAITEFEATLRRTGAFRSVTRWSLGGNKERTETVGDLEIRDSAGSVHHADFIIDPAGRRLVLLLTDGVAGSWHSARIWQALGRWAHAMPPAVVHLLPETYWGYTAIGRPTAVMRSRRPAGPNSAVEVMAAWWSHDDDAHAGIPVPVIALRP